MEHPEYLLTYDDLEKAGFDQMPCAGNHSSPTNMGDTIRYCRQHIAPERLKGFQVAPWYTMRTKYDHRRFAAMDQFAEAMASIGETAK